MHPETELSEGVNFYGYVSSRAECVPGVVYACIYICIFYGFALFSLGWKFHRDLAHLVNLPPPFICGRRLNIILAELISILFCCGCVVPRHGRPFLAERERANEKKKKPNEMIMATAQRYNLYSDMEMLRLSTSSPMNCNAALLSSTFLRLYSVCAPMTCLYNGRGFIHF